jgi:hypothetical protein
MSEFDELLEKHLDLVKVAFEGRDHYYGYDTLHLFAVRPYVPELDALMAAIKPDVEALGIPADKIEKATELVAKELISMYQFPDTGGAQEEGSIHGRDDAEEMNPDIMEGADEPAPPAIVVEVKLPKGKS